MKKYILSILLSLCIGSSFAATHSVVLETIPGCPACQQAKECLNSAHIKYTIKDGSHSYGFFPKFYVDGKYLGGADAACNYAQTHRG